MGPDFLTQGSFRAWPLHRLAPLRAGPLDASRYAWVTPLLQLGLLGWAWTWAWGATGHGDRSGDGTQFGSFVYGADGVKGGR